MGRTTKKTITDKRLRFCQEYVKDNNGTQAAIRAGYSKKTAKAQASRLLTNVDVKSDIAQLNAKIAKKIEDKVEMTAVECLNSFVRIAEKAEKAEDLSNANRALENLGKHFGVYDADNKQQGIRFIIEKY